MDNFSNIPTTLTAPARDASAVAPSDSIDLPVIPRAIYVGQAGHLAGIMMGGQGVAFQNVPAGTVLPVRMTRINATGTTAAAILALW